MSFRKEDLQRFDGRSSARAWAFHVRRYRAFVDAEEPGQHGEADWLSKLALHLDGPAAEHLEVLQQRQQGAVFPFTTVEQLLEHYIALYSPPGSQADPRDDLDKCVQRGPVSGYIQRFTSIKARIPRMEEDDVLHRFITGLSPALASEVRLHHPANVIEAMRLAADADASVYRREHQRSRYGSGFAHPSHPGSSSSGSSSYAAPRAPDHGHPVPMELGSAVAGPSAAAAGGYPPVRCMLCKKLGHLWQQCRRKNDFTCPACGRRGHPGSACPNRSNFKGR